MRVPLLAPLSAPPMIRRVDGVDTVVREPDGMHLSDAGARVLALAVGADLAGDFVLPDGATSATG